MRRALPLESRFPSAPYNPFMTEGPSYSSNRRDFLRGKSALQALEGLADSFVAKEPLPPARSAHEASFLCEIARPAMACEFAIYLDAKKYPCGPEAAVTALDLIDTLENQLSVYRPTSEVSRINANAAREALPVEACLFELFELALKLHQLTGGAFDIASGQLIKAWGFYRRQGAIPDDHDRADALAKSGSQYIELEPTARSIRFRRAGVELNLGAIGKGYALDRASDQLFAAGIHDFIFHGGASSVVARGSHAAMEAHDQGWLVGIKHPLRPERRLAEIRLHNEALGTSGTGAQFFQHQGIRFGHILDPRSGQPAQGLLSVTVVAPSAALADSLSTALFVMGYEAALEWLETNRAAQPAGPRAVVFVRPGLHLGEVQLSTWGMTSDRWRVLE